jgi:hypothetical protein
VKNDQHHKHYGNGRGRTFSGNIFVNDTNDTNDTNGRKFDSGKLQYGLIPPEALRQTVEVLTYGATKYAPDNWRYVPGAKRRYFDAAQRHLWAWKAGEATDSETNASHLAHAICCLMFLLEAK